MSNTTNSLSFEHEIHNSTANHIQRLLQAATLEGLPWAKRENKGWVMFSFGGDAEVLIPNVKSPTAKWDCHIELPAEFKPGAPGGHRGAVMCNLPPVTDMEQLRLLVRLLAGASKRARLAPHRRTVGVQGGTTRTIEINPIIASIPVSTQPKVTAEEVDEAFAALANQDDVILDETETE